MPLNTCLFLSLSFIHSFFLTPFLVLYYYGSSRKVLGPQISTLTQKRVDLRVGRRALRMRGPMMMKMMRMIMMMMNVMNQYKSLMESRTIVLLVKYA